MSSNRVRALRPLVVIMLVLLALQYELGMAVNISNPPSLPPVSPSLSVLSDALNKAGAVAVLHGSVGGLLLLLSLVLLVMSLLSHVRGAQIFGSLGFLAVLFAADGGSQFVLSGFQNDGRSHEMATMWLLSFVFYFLEVYVLKPSPRG